MKIRLTKYNPIFRDSSGRYLKCEWTSSSEIGKKFGSDVFTLQEYLNTEVNVVNTIIDILKLYDCSELSIDGFEIYDEKDNQISELSNTSPKRIIDDLIAKTHQDLQHSSRDILLSLLSVTSLRNGKVINILEVEDCIKLCLREILFLNFKADSNTYVHFGYDFYVYLGTCKPISRWTLQIPDGLFVEFCYSPYAIKI